MRIAIHPLNTNDFMLPITNNMSFPENASDSSMNNPALSSKKGKKELVLILSKESDTRFLFKTLLEMWNYRVEVAESFEELLFIDGHAQARLILMDTSLPFADNMAKMQCIRQMEVFRQLPIVLISGHSQPRYREQAFSNGADDFLVKPVDFDLLEDCLKRNINRDDRQGRL
jgi:CheY-like chemotaxis protein